MHGVDFTIECNESLSFVSLATPYEVRRPQTLAVALSKQASCVVRATPSILQEGAKIAKAWRTLCFLHFLLFMFPPNFPEPAAGLDEVFSFI